MKLTRTNLLKFSLDRKLQLIVDLIGYFSVVAFFICDTLFEISLETLFLIGVPAVLSFIFEFAFLMPLKRARIGDEKFYSSNSSVMGQFELMIKEYSPVILGATMSCCIMVLMVKVFPETIMIDSQLGIIILFGSFFAHMVLFSYLFHWGTVKFLKWFFRL